jgi:hypothetical protein
MKNTNQLAYEITALLRKSARKNREPRVLQNTIDRTFESGAEVITFMNTNGDWFKIFISDAIGPEE